MSPLGTVRAEALLGDICDNAMSAASASAVNYSNLDNYRSGRLLMAVCSRRWREGAGRRAGAGGPSDSLSTVDGVGRPRMFRCLLPGPQKLRKRAQEPAVPKAHGILPASTQRLNRPMASPSAGQCHPAVSQPWSLSWRAWRGKRPLSPGLGSTEPARGILETSTSRLWKDELLRVPLPQRPLLCRETHLQSPSSHAAFPLRLRKFPSS